MREVFQGLHDETGLVDLCAALRAIANVGLEGTYPKAHLVIEEEVNFVGKQVPVIHGVSEEAYGAGCKFVSAIREVFLVVISVTSRCLP